MKISVITVVHNGVDCIGETMRSLNGQSCDLFEHIVVDGLSNDGTLDVVNSLKSDKTRVYSGRDNGIYSAMNKGILYSTGDIIGFLNSDDVYAHKNVLRDIQNAFLKDSELEAVFGDLSFYDQKMNCKVRDWEFKGHGDFKLGWHPAHPTFYVRRELFEKYGGFREELSMSADFELMLRFLEKQKVKAEYVDKPFVKMRVGGVSTRSFKNIIKGIKQTRNAFIMNGIRYPVFYPFYRYWPKVKGKFLNNNNT